MSHFWMSFDCPCQWLPATQKKVADTGFATGQGLCLKKKGIATCPNRTLALAHPFGWMSQGQLPWAGFLTLGPGIMASSDT